MAFGTYPVWHNSGGINHWLPYLWLPLLAFLALGFLIKFPPPTQTKQATINIELVKSTPPQSSKQATPQKTSDQVNPNPTTQKVVAEPVQNLVEPAPKIIKSKNTNSNRPRIKQESKIQTQQPKTTVTTATLLKQAHSIPDLTVTDEFKPRQAMRFITPEIEANDAYADIPYLPTDSVYRMDLDFYALGIEGNIDRFFDNVILQKTFTTKYGTKINCALAVVLLCSWK